MGQKKGRGREKTKNEYDRVLKGSKQKMAIFTLSDF